MYGTAHPQTHTVNHVARTFSPRACLKTQRLEAPKGNLHVARKSEPRQARPSQKPSPETRTSTFFVPDGASCGEYAFPFDSQVQQETKQNNGLLQLNADKQTPPLTKKGGGKRCLLLVVETPAGSYFPRHSETEEVFDVTNEP